MKDKNEASKRSKGRKKSEEIIFSEVKN